MSSKKKRTKKYNKLNDDRRRYRQMTEGLVIGVIYEGNEPKGTVYDLSIGEPQTISSKTDKAFQEGVFKWTVLMCVFYRDQMGEEYADFQELESPTPCLYAQLAQSLAATTVDMMQRGNPLHMLTFGIIASPNPVEFNRVIADKIFSNLGAYSDFVSEWEHKHKGEGVAVTGLSSSGAATQ